MQYMTDTPAGIQVKAQEIVEVKLWEAYLLYYRSNLYRILSNSSLDKGAVEKDHHEPGRVTFRFTADEWENNIKHLLYERRIPVMVKASHPINKKIRAKQETLV